MDNRDKQYADEQKEKALHDDQLTIEQFRFRNKLNKVRAATRLSASATAQLMDVSPGAMAKWFEVNPTTGRLRTPAQYLMDSVSYKIDVLNAANEEGGTYAHLRGMKPNERVQLLQNVLESDQIV